MTAERPTALSRGTLPRTVAAAALLAVALLPAFFVLYRLSLFNTLPRDDYAPYLLALLGRPGGAFAESPYVYRILSVLAAAPFYFALPVIPLTNTPPGLPVETLRATAAFAMLAHLALVGSAVAAYRLARDRAAASPGVALIAGGLLYGLSWYTQVVAIDPLALLFITLGLYLLERPIGFAGLMLLSVVVNEKILIVFFLWLGLRLLLVPADRRVLTIPWLASVAALLLYGALVTGLHIPGNSYQLEPGGYLATLRANLAAQISARGVLLNGLPVVLLLVLGLAGHRPEARPPTGPEWRLFRPADLLMIPVMAAVALVLTQFFQVGRLVMHVAPLFLVPAAGMLFARLGSPRP